MGILNANGDSFFGPSRVQGLSPEVIADHARKMEEAGADCLDIGAESTRPGSSYIDDTTEISRLLPVLRAVRKAVTIPLSIDTRKSSVARVALDEGADMINDISALEDDPELADLCADRGCPVILMHKQGVPESMQVAPRYGDCPEEVTRYLVERCAFARSRGIVRLMIDPGLGFGKSPEDNLALLGNLPTLCGAGVPVLIAASRKGFISRCTAVPEKEPSGPENRLGGSIAVACWAALHGAHMVRVHDVAETVQAMRLTGCLSGGRVHV